MQQQLGLIVRIYIVTLSFNSRRFKIPHADAGTTILLSSWLRYWIIFMVPLGDKLEQ
jgi:hypothetical protein